MPDTSNLDRTASLITNLFSGIMLFCVTEDWQYVKAVLSHFVAPQFVGIFSFLLTLSCGFLLFQSLQYNTFLSTSADTVKMPISIANARLILIRGRLSSSYPSNRLFLRRAARLLDWAGVAFHDIDLKQERLSRLLRLSSPAPLWTAASFERCVTFAFAYPILTLYAAWLLSGTVGPLGSMMYQRADPSVPERVLMLASSLAWFSSISAGISFAQAFTPNLKALLASAACVIIVSVMERVFGATPGFEFFFSVWLAIAIRLPGYIFIIILSVCLFVIGKSMLEGDNFRVSIAFTLLIPLGLSAMLQKSISYYIVKPIALPILFLLSIAACYFAGHRLPRFTPDGYDFYYSLIVYCVLIPIVNVPSDWMSIGLTRYLLRLGLQLGGIWPFVLSIADLIITAFNIVVLCSVILIAIQSFTDISMRGNLRYLDVSNLLDKVSTGNVGLGELWFGLILLWTALPSLANFLTAFISVTRPPAAFTTRLVALIPNKLPVAAPGRWLLSALLAVHDLTGVVIGIALQTLLIAVVWRYIAPLFGGGFFSEMYSLVGLDLPLFFLRTIHLRY